MLLLNHRIHIPEALRSQIHSITFFDTFGKQLPRHYSKYDVEIMRSRSLLLQKAFHLNVFAAAVVLPLIILTFLLILLLTDHLTTGQYSLLVLAYVMIAALLTMLLIKLRLGFGPFALYGFALSALFVWVGVMFPFLALVPFLYYQYQSAFSRSALFHGHAILLTLDLIFLTSLISSMLNLSYHRMQRE